MNTLKLEKHDLKPETLSNLLFSNSQKDKASLNNRKDVLNFDDDGIICSLQNESENSKETSHGESATQIAAQSPH